MDNKGDEKIKELMKRGVEKIYPNDKFLGDLLKSNKKIKLYLGIDPTGPTLHLGHAIVMNKLRQFQEWGHEVVLLIGSFTAMIGDPTDKSAVRKKLSREQIMENCKNYKKQASKILNFEGNNPVKIKYNHEWLEKLNFGEVVELSSHFTVQRLLERDMFEVRIKKEKPIYLNEFLYPLMQGYDSVYMDVNGEVGGNDQTFNMLAGRELMKELKSKEKFVLTTKLLTDVAGVKMGKSEGNMLTLDDSADDMYGKIMSWTDGMIGNGFELCTNVPMDEVKKIKDELYKKKSVNPKDYKMKLAFEVVRLYYNEREAEKAQENFINLFQKKEIPDNIKEFRVKEDTALLVDILVNSALAKSKSEARRLIEQGGVKVNSKALKDWKVGIIAEDGTIIQVGKRRFLKIVK